MIDNIYSNSKYLIANGGTGATYISNYSGTLGAGNVRFNSSIQKFEVCDGATWIAVNGGIASLGLSADAERCLDYVGKLMIEEREYEKLAETNEAVRIAVENVKKAQSQLKATAILAKDHENEISS